MTARRPTADVLQAIGDTVAQVSMVGAAIALFVIVGINGANVFCRYFLGFAWSWAEEAMLFLMIFMVFAGATAATWHGGHMRLDLFVERLSLPWQRAAILFTALFSVAILGWLSASSYQVVALLYSFGQQSTALGFPMWIPQGCVLAGLVLIALMILLRLAVFGATLPKSEIDTLAGPPP